MPVSLTGTPPGDGEAAQLVAAECVIDAETKDHMNWELIGKAAAQLKGHEGKAVKDAYKKVEDEEDAHLYHTMGWARELWIESMCMPAVLPRGAIEAAKAKKAREKML
jgi:hypothetical protein